MPRGVGAQPKRLNLPYDDVKRHPQKLKYKTSQLFFIEATRLRIFRGLEQLSSAWRVMAKYVAGTIMASAGVKGCWGRSILTSKALGPYFQFVKLSCSINVEALVRGSATWPECPRKEWRNELCRLHPRENTRQVDQGPGDVYMFTTWLGVEPEEVSEDAENHDVFWDHIRLRNPPQINPGLKSEWLSSCYGLFAHLATVHTRRFVLHLGGYSEQPDILFCTSLRLQGFAVTNRWETARVWHC